MAPRPLPQSWPSPCPPTIAHYNSTLQWPLGVAPRPLHPAMAPCCHVQSAKVVRCPPPLLEVRTPIAIAIWGNIYYIIYICKYLQEHYTHILSLLRLAFPLLPPSRHFFRFQLHGGAKHIQGSRPCCTRGARLQTKARIVWDGDTQLTCKVNLPSRNLGCDAWPYRI